MQKSLAFRIGFLSVLSCLVLLLGMFTSTGTASAYSAAPAHTATSATGGPDWGGTGGGGFGWGDFGGRDFGGGDFGGRGFGWGDFGGSGYGYGYYPNWGYSGWDYNPDWGFSEDCYSDPYFADCGDSFNYHHHHHHHRTHKTIISEP